MLIINVYFASSYKYELKFQKYFVLFATLPISSTSLFLFLDTKLLFSFSSCRSFLARCKSIISRSFTFFTCHSLSFGSSKFILLHTEGFPNILNVQLSIIIQAGKRPECNMFLMAICSSLGHRKTGGSSSLELDVFFLFSASHSESSNPLTCRWYSSSSLMVEMLLLSDSIGVGS